MKHLKKGIQLALAGSVLSLGLLVSGGVSAEASVVSPKVLVKEPVKSPIVKAPIFKTPIIKYPITRPVQPPVYKF